MKSYVYPEILYPKKDLRSIIYNLLSNAIKYRSRERPLKIDIRTWDDVDIVILSIKDNGIGLNEAQAPKLLPCLKDYILMGKGQVLGCTF